MNAGPLTERLATELARQFTTPGLRDKPVEARLDQEMVRSFSVGGGIRAMSPVTPREAAEVVVRVLERMHAAGECGASLSGHCLQETEGDVGCATRAGECIRSGKEGTST